MRLGFFISCTVVLATMIAPFVHGAELIASTKPLTPQEQLKRFRVPKGFQIQLVASEPRLHKPMNLNFDARGRLWVSHSVEYPYPAREGSPRRDRITVFSELDERGYAQKAVDFAVDLNIPIGVTPLSDGSEAIAWSIPSIWKLRDRDGDGVADQREPLLTGFGYVDTHGNQNGFTRWLDGWVYANHGFKNHSKIRLPQAGHADDRALLELESGNTYRFSPDGLHAEQLTHGQVNPFGVAFDVWGYRYTADCHSRPIYQMIDGAYYPSFGKNDDGLGFGPTMINHDHGSTGIGGVALYLDDHYPPEYRGNVFLSNVVTGIVHRDRLTWRGSSPTAHKLDDFVTCDDPWFHPVDVKLGPDGALYICDFYNAIIGHYEVALDHPQRDRERGRVWRVVYVGEQGDGPPARATPRATDLTSLSPEQLGERLGDANLSLRTLATHWLVDRHGDAAAAVARKLLVGGAGGPQAPDTAFERDAQRAHAAWVLHRLNQLTADDLLSLAGDPMPLVRTHAARILEATPGWDTPQRRLAAVLLNDLSPHVRRAAIQAMRRHPDVEQLWALLARWDSEDAADDHMVHALRVAIKHHMIDDGITQQLMTQALSPQARQRLTSIAAAVPSEPAALLIYQFARDHPDDVAHAVLEAALPRVIPRLPGAESSNLIKLVRARFGSDTAAQLRLLMQIDGVVRESQAEAAAALRDWLSELLDRVVTKPMEHGAWADCALDDAGAEKHVPTWAWQHRDAQEIKETKEVIRVKGVALLSSFTKGEQRTGMLRSPEFTLPPSLSFLLCGHNGKPDQKDHGKNRVRLVLADSGAVIAQQTPPRSDVARRYEWKLPEHAGKRVRFEAIDGDDADAYAWLAFGGFKPEVVALPASDPVDSAHDAAELIEMAARRRLKSIEALSEKLLIDPGVMPEARIAAGKALLRVSPAAAEPRGMSATGEVATSGDVTAVWRAFNDAATPLALRSALGEALGGSQRSDARAAAAVALARVPEPVQRAVAMGLAGTKPGAEALLEAIEKGKASPRLLLDKSLAERLRGSKVEKVSERIAELTQGLVPADQKLAELMAQVRAAYQQDAGSAEAGQAVFLKHCAVCHQIAGQGARVGPTLDGIGGRGVERLLEDVLDPNRNIDRAFRASEISTDSDGVILGLVQREEGGTLVLTDTTGKERRIATADIASRRELPLSLMPANFSEAVSEAELRQLLAFLLAQRAKP